MSDPITEPEAFVTRIEMSAGVAVRFSSEILPQLYVNPGKHRHFALPYELATAKRYFLSRCLMDVQRAAAAQIRLVDHLRAEQARDPATTEALKQLFLESIITEQGVWRRRLVEALARLILFGTTNSDEHFFRYLVLVDSAESAREAEHAEKDFSAVSKTLARRAENLRARVASPPTSQPLWYAQPAKKGTLALPPASTLIREAVKLGTSAERTALGYSYEHGFAVPSQIVHFSTTARRHALDHDLLEFGAGQTMLLACAIVSRAADLAGLQLSAPLIGTAAHGKADLPAVGDFVVVTLDPETVFLAEVLATRAAAGVVGSVRVRFIGDAPYSDILDDDIPSDLIQPFLCCADLRATVAANFPKEAPAPKEEVLVPAMRYAAEKAWTLGIRAFVLRYLAAAHEARAPNSGQ